MQLYTDDRKLEMSARLVRVQSDLKTALQEFPRESSGINILSDKIGIHSKTIKRILQGSHSPSYKTVLKIYRYLTGSMNDRDTVMAMPQILSDFIANNNENFKLSKGETNFSVEVDYLLENDSIFRYIYLETASGTIHKSKVGYECGQLGLKVLQKMVDLDVIIEVQPEVYASSKNRASLRTETIHDLGKFLIDNKFNTEKCKTLGENFCSLYIDGVSKEAYNELLTVDWEAKERKKNILMNQKNKGSIKYWSVIFTDTLSTSYIYSDNDGEVLQ